MACAGQRRVGKRGYFSCSFPLDVAGRKGAALAGRRPTTMPPPPPSHLLAAGVGHGVVPAPLHRHPQVLQLAHAADGAVALASLREEVACQGEWVDWWEK